MNFAVLRVTGTIAVIGTMTEAMDFRCDTQWNAGDPKPDGTLEPRAGCNVTIAEAESPREMMGVVKTFLARWKVEANRWTGEDFEAELDIGVLVGAEGQFVAGITFSPSELALCAECGIALGVTAYPTSDDEGGGEGAT